VTDKLLLFSTAHLLQALELMLIVLVADKPLLFPTAHLLQTLELMTGIEPVTSPLPRECSTN
jgi:hypothetical protein